jgi:hypothetical protein
VRLFYIFAANIAKVLGTIEAFKLTVYSDVRDGFMGPVNHEHRDSTVQAFRANSLLTLFTLHLIFMTASLHPSPSRRGSPSSHTQTHTRTHARTRARARTQRVNDWKVMYWYEFTNGGVKYFPKLTCLQ